MRSRARCSPGAAPAGAHKLSRQLAGQCRVCCGYLSARGVLAAARLPLAGPVGRSLPAIRGGGSCRAGRPVARAALAVTAAPVRT